jgi:hypothetical protein
VCGGGGSPGRVCVVVDHRQIILVLRVPRKKPKVDVTRNVVVNVPERTAVVGVVPVIGSDM